MFQKTPRHPARGFYVLLVFRPEITDTQLFQVTLGNTWN